MDAPEEMYISVVQGHSMKLSDPVDVGLEHAVHHYGTTNLLFRCRPIVTLDVYQMRELGQVVLGRKAIRLQAEEVGVAEPERSEYQNDKYL